MNYVIVIIALGFLIAFHEGGHYLFARVLGMKVLKYSIGFGKPIFSWTSKKTEIAYQVGMVPLGGFVQVKGMNPFEEGAYEDADSYQLKSPWKRALVIVAGPLANLLLAWFIVFSVLTFSGLPEPVNESRLGDVVSNDLAQKAGLKKDDRIVRVNGEEVKTWNDLVRQINRNPKKEISLVVRRGNRILDVTVTPREGKNGLGMIGIHMPVKMVSMPAGGAALFATKKCYSVVADTLTALAGLFTKKKSNVSAVGPVGIVKMAAEHLERGVVEFLSLIYYISLMLFLFNLLPIPALDGGRTVFLLYEVVARKRVNKKFDAILNTAFFFLLMGLLVVISFKELFWD